jgi:hypothetical protein
MGIEELVSMKEIKGKLKDLEKYFPAQAIAIYDFGKLISDELKPQSNPSEFYLSAIIALGKIQKEKKYPQETSAVLMEHIPDIAYAVCPLNFAKEIVRMDSILREARPDIYPNG